MAASNGTGLASAPSQNGASAEVAERRRAFRSVLFAAESDADLGDVAEPDIFRDLHLDQVLAAMTDGREEYDLASFFYTPLHDPSAVDYRHEVFHDLEKPDVREAVTGFARGMARMRRHWEQVEKLHYRQQKQAWFVEGAGVYCDAVRALASDLEKADVGSRGLKALREYVTAYLASGEFSELAKEVADIKSSFGEIRYALKINGARVSVSEHAGEPDYGAEVADAFARFQQGAVGSYLARLPESADMNHVEAQIVDCVAKLYPAPFRARAEFCQRHGDYLDATIARFDREAQFYLGYLELVERIRARGLDFCYPEVSEESKETVAQDTFDLALADKLARDAAAAVPNEFHLDGPERMFVVSGPNNGGKTTFARMFGQLHYLASLGLLVPGSKAKLFLPDRIYTHFEREEDIETLRGKFEDELVRVHAILEQATASSVIVMNESFGSTSLDDARFVGTEVMRRILELGALGVYVTFIDEIASMSDATVSMVSQIVPEDPAQRTFKVVRKPADGRAYAWAIAEKYGLTYDRLMERVSA